MDYCYKSLEVSEPCLGAIISGRKGGERASRGLLERCAAVGGALTDAADVYSQAAFGTLDREPLRLCGGRP